MKILVTGATGFVGNALVRKLVEDRREVRGAVRRDTQQLPAGVARVVVGDVTEATDWLPALAGVEMLVHLAARVHVMHDTPDALDAFRRVNVAATMNLARQASAAGVRRMVLLSSIKVNGERGVYTEADKPDPQDLYGISKLEAEVGVRQIAAETGMQAVIIRPPLVYGPGVKANFRSLMTAIARGIPLPLGAIHNRRSLVALDNLVDFIIACLDVPAAANETFLVSDGEDLSTTDLIRRLARSMGRPPRLIPVSAAVLRIGAALFGKADIAARLLDSLQVDISKARYTLGWAPPISVDEGLRRAVASI